LTFDRVWLLAAVSLVAFSVLRNPVLPYDSWWHLAMGREIAAQGRIPTSDTFSFTRNGHPWFNAYWLGQLLFYQLHHVGGMELLLLVQSVLLTVAYAGLLWLCVRTSSRRKLSAAFLMVVVIPLSMGNWYLRPQSYAIPLFAAFMIVIHQYKQRTRAALYALPLVMVGWVNIHGSFVLGLVLMGAAVVGEVLDRRFRSGGSEGEVLPRPGLTPMIGWGIATAAATLVNPRGIGALAYVRDLTQNDAVRRAVSEWQPLTVNEVGGVIFFGLLGICFLAFVYSRRPLLPSEALLFMGFLLLALSARRNVMWFVFVAAPIVLPHLAELFPRLLRDGSEGNPRLNRLVAALLAVLVVSCLPWVKPLVWGSAKPLLGTDTPVKAADYLRGAPDRPRHLFHENGYGAYLIWAVPDQPVFIDPRFELYPLSQWEDYMMLSRGHDVEPLLAKYDIDGLLLSRAQQGRLIDAVRHDRCDRWEERYSDEISVYFARRPGAPQCCPCPAAEQSAR
jgi:hypothetical protein